MLKHDRVRFRGEIIRCDACGGLIEGPSDYDVALCHCHNAQKKKPGRSAAPRVETANEDHPQRLDKPLYAYAWSFGELYSPPKSGSGE